MKTTDIFTIIEFIKEQIVYQKITLAELERETEYSWSDLYEILEGRYSIRMNVLYAFLVALNLRLVISKDGFEMSVDTDKEVAK